MRSVWLKGWLLAYTSIGLFGAGLASASTEGVVISQIYGGNGNVHQQDYVELFNASNVPVNISGWSIQYASATGSGNFANNGVTSLAGTLQPGQYYLVGLASASSGAALPSLDAEGNSNLSGSRGKVVLVDNSNGLACNGSSTACSNNQIAQIVDLVGYGSANYFETAAAPSSSSSSALFRAQDGCTDTDNNASDFSVASPAPRNSNSMFNVCGSVVPSTEITPSCQDLSITAGQSGSVQLSAADSDSIVNAASIVSQAVSGISLSDFISASADGESATVNLQVADSVATGIYQVQILFNNNDAQSANCTSTVTVNDPSGITPIYDIQGNGNASSFDGQQVTTQGIVSAVFDGLRGFYLQDEFGDNNPDTSDGIFVFVGSAPTVSEGDEIILNATVDEYFTITELTNPNNIQVDSTNNNVLPTEIAFPETTEGDLEKVEGMLVKITTPMTASQNYFQGRYGQVSLSSNGRLIKPNNKFRPDTQDNADLVDENARRRITLDDGTTAQNANPIPYIGQDNTLRAGDIVDEITGVIHHGLITSTSSANGGPSDYLIHPTEAVVFNRVNARTTTPAPAGGNIQVASFNVLNYFTTFQDGNTVDGASGQGCSQGGSVTANNCRGADNLNEFYRQEAKIANAIVALNADVIGLMEIQNNGATALQSLVDALNAIAGAGTYAIVDDTTIDMGTDAIKNGLIYKPASLSLDGSALSDTHPINDRPTLAQTFVAKNGDKFSVLVNHFKSKRCNSPTGLNMDQYDGLGCWNLKRTQEAQQLAAFAETVKSTAEDDDILIIGDLNAYGKEDPVDSLSQAGYEDQVARFEGDDAYSYTFDGEAGYLDHALANTPMAGQINTVAHWHINTDEPSVIDYNTEFKSQDLYTESVYRSSDHDPVIVGLNLYKQHSGGRGLDNLVGTTGDDRMVGGIGRDMLTGREGNDIFVYNSLRDAGDIIMDFTPGEDKIDLSAMLRTVGYAGNNPFTEGYARLISNRGRVYLQIDADGPGRSRYRTLALLLNVDTSTIEYSRDFIW